MRAERPEMISAECLSVSEILGKLAPKAKRLLDHSAAHAGGVPPLEIAELREISLDLLDRLVHRGRWTTEDQLVYDAGRETGDGSAGDRLSGYVSTHRLVFRIDAQARRLIGRQGPRAAGLERMRVDEVVVTSLPTLSAL
jgi:hypothetical protein